MRYAAMFLSAYSSIPSTNSSSCAYRLTRARTGGSQRVEAKSAGSRPRVPAGVNAGRRFGNEHRERARQDLDLERRGPDDVPVGLDGQGKRLAMATLFPATRNSAFARHPKTMPDRYRT